MNPLESFIKYRPDIDGLRFIAIISVLIYHLDFQAFSGGFVGVDVFFVISGFLITNLLKREIETTEKFNIKHFYIRRVRRLLPALVVVLFLTILFSILVFSPTHLSRIGGALTSTIASFSNIYYWLETDYFDVSSKLKPFLHTWSLSIEEQFYLIWPLLLWGLMTIKKSWLVPSFLILAGIISLYLNQIFGDGSVEVISSTFPNMVEFIKNGNATIFFLLPFRVFEFAIGALVVWFIHIKTKQWLYDLFFMVGLILIGYAVFNFDDEMLFPSYYGLVPTIGAALIIYSGHYSRLSAVLSNKLSVAIGLISYSLYLIHWPIIVFWTYLAGSIDMKAAIIITLVSFVLAILNYFYVEQAFRKKRYELSTSKWKYTAIFLVMMLAYLGINIKQNNGWTWRIPKTVVFEDMGNAKDFHIKMWGGAGYKDKGFVDSTKKKADIVLIGDSHGNHYANGLYKILAKDKNLSLYVSNCFSSIYLPKFIRVDKKSYIQISIESLSKDIPYIKNGNNPIIILSQSWLSQMSKADIVDENGTRKYVKVTVKDIIQGIYDLREIIGDSSLVVIGNVPGARYNLYDIFSRPRPLFFSDFDPNKYLEVSPYPDRVEFNRQLKEAAEESGKFIFLDPHDVLCKNGKCRNIDINKKLIYSDENHLSKYGSIEVIKGFVSEFNKILQP